MLIEILLVVNGLLLTALIFLFLRRESRDSQQFESTLSRVWLKLGIDEKIGRLEVYANDIRHDYRELEQMLRVPTARGSLGELGLETILADQLPPEVYGIRKRILNGKIPDAYVDSTVGIICIDSKFPLDNYRRVLEAETTEKDRHKKQFLRDVQGHLKKVAQDYICPVDGSADFAFAYIPAEGVYWFLASEAPDLLRHFAKQGVQVVSPLTLCHKVELIKTGMFAKKLTDEADKIRSDIARLNKAFARIDDEWKTFYQTHFKYLAASAHRIDDAYQGLRGEFDQIAKLSED
jgi:DNA recombination protein RmuC